MGRIVVTEYISVDGVVEAPSGTENFERVGWTDAFSRGPEGEKFKLDETMASDALLLGRVTYDGFAPVWPHYQGEVADKFNTMPKYVISSTLVDPGVEQHNRAARRRGRRSHDAQAAARRRHRRPRQPAAGADADRARLIDALHLQVYPVIVGAGRRLFAETSNTKRLRLVEARTVGDGIHILIYERAA